MDWPLVGRDEELDLVRDATERGSGVVIAGAAGVGKTRLASECIRAASAAGFATEWVVATEAGAEIPFGAFAHVLLPPKTEFNTRLELLLRARLAITERTGGRALVLGVDDVHLLDSGSAILVHQMAGAEDTSVVVTVRTGPPASDPIVALWKDGLANRLELQGHTRAEVDHAGVGGPGRSGRGGHDAPAVDMDARQRTAAPRAVTWGRPRCRVPPRAPRRRDALR